MAKEPRVTDWQRNENCQPGPIFIIQPERTYGRTGPPNEDEFGVIFSSVCSLTALVHVGNLDTGGGRYNDPSPRAFKHCGGSIIVSTRIDKKKRDEFGGVTQSIFRCSRQDCGSIMASAFSREEYRDLISDLMLKQMVPKSKRLMYMDCNQSHDGLIRRLGLVSVAPSLFQGRSNLVEKEVPKSFPPGTFSLGFVVAEGISTLTEEMGLRWLQYLVRKQEERAEGELNGRTRRVLLGYGQNLPATDLF